ncbi:uncharacterized protein A4U43_C03F24320 [Asparagus officinalis]|uniref:Uncharacterized protein n=1 Tax=Asparagus officinalis TaxID=4686 RepID=A0A5P1FCK2_ASPOF|nr:uncharacterized protein A4U43_C03F24320 [Asparagus officinalis]
MLRERKRDQALEQVELDRHAAQHLKPELEEERAALKTLQEESAQYALVSEPQCEFSLTKVLKDERMSISSTRSLSGKTKLVLDVDDGDEGDEESREESERDNRDEVAPAATHPAPASKSSATFPSRTPDPI